LDSSAESPHEHNTRDFDDDPATIDALRVNIHKIDELD
jgi:hypothetical protein